MENDPLVSFLILTRNRRDDLAEIMQHILEQVYLYIEIIVVDNASTDDTRHLFQELFNYPNIHYYRTSRNLGVCGGRNEAIRRAKGDILVTVDDDAIINDQYATSKIVQKFQNDHTAAILAFKIVNYFSGNLQQNAFPSLNKSKDPDVEFETTWIIGAGHAVRREIYEQVGLYRDYYPYGQEEFDFSLRVVDNGFRIMYFPSVTILHKESPEGRMASPTKFTAINLKHRIKAAILNLPVYSILSYLIIWSGFWFLKARGNIIAILLAYYWLIRDMPTMLRERKPLEPSAIERIKVLKGRLYY